MRILFVINNLTRVGGIRVVFEYARRLHKDGHEVGVIYPLFPLQIKARSVRKSILVIQDAFRNQIMSAFRRRALWSSEYSVPLIRVPTLHPRYARLIDKLVPDADVILATAWETAYTVAKLSEKKGEKFYFVQHYEVWDLWNSEECWRELKELWPDDVSPVHMAAIHPRKERLQEVKQLVDQTFKLPLRKITVSGWLKRLIVDEFGERVDGTVVDGVDFDVFYKIGDRSAFDRQKRVLMPYREDIWKGLMDGLAAFVKVKTRCPGVRFTVYGRKPSFLDAKHAPEIPEWVEFCDSPTDADLAALYNESDIFVSPSWAEGFSLPAVEAMACGCALVSTRAGGISDCLTNGETALLVPIQDPHALAAAICTLIEDDSQRRRIAENGHTFAKLFTWEAATKKLERILETQVRQSDRAVREK
jgi:glycosyltransferase involved in cell wall biosynthesis